MAKRRPSTQTDHKKNLDQKAYVIDTGNGQVDRAVYDETTHEKLDVVIGALGGSLDTTVEIFNLQIANANQEYNQVLPANTKSFLLKSRNKGILKIAYSSGETVTGNYITIPMGANFKDLNFYSSVTIYVQSNKPGDIIEIIAYS